MFDHIVLSILKRSAKCVRVAGATRPRRSLGSPPPQLVGSDFLQLFLEEAHAKRRRNFYGHLFIQITTVMVTFGWLKDVKRLCLCLKKLTDGSEAFFF